MISDRKESLAVDLRPGLKFRMATWQDTAQVVALLNQTFRTPMDAPTWEWYAYGNPHGPSRVYLALEQDEHTIAGVVGFAPIQLRIQGASVAGDYAHHLALKPKYRDTLSYVALLRYALQAEASLGVKLAIGPPNRTAYPIHKKLMKWVDFGFLDRLRKVSPFAREHSCLEADIFSDEFDSFYDRVSQGLSFCLEKNAAWMNWRFCRRPGAPYTVYTARNGKELAGYIILKRWQEADGYKKAHVMDLHAIDEPVLLRLMAAAESYASGCQELNLWAAKGYAYRSSLEALDFVASSDRQPLLARIFNGPCMMFPDGNSSLSYGDGDSQY